MLMPLPHASASSPRTLGEAKTVIASLRAQLAAKPPPGGGKPIPPDTSDPRPNPDRGVGPPKSLVDPGLGNMAPAVFADFLSRCDNQTLKILLSRECSKNRKLKNDHLVRKLYEEIKRRKL
jgi:hypothetical protein